MLTKNRLFRHTITFSASNWEVLLRGTELSYSFVVYSYYFITLKRRQGLIDKHVLTFQNRLNRPSSL